MSPPRRWKSAVAATVTHFRQSLAARGGQWLAGGLRREWRSAIIRSANHTITTEAALTYIITEPCIGTKDASCVEVCPVDCIYEAGEQYLIHPDECIDCGACEPECPVQAIFPDTDVPPEWSDYIEKNANHFE